MCAEGEDPLRGAGQLAQEAAPPACAPDTALMCVCVPAEGKRQRHSRKAANCGDSIPEAALDACERASGGRQPAYLHTQMAEVSGRFDALKRGAVQGAWTSCPGEARLAVPGAGAPLDRSALVFLGACRRQEKRGEGEPGLSSLLAGGVSINPSPPTHA